MLKLWTTSNEQFQLEFTGTLGHLSTQFGKLGAKGRGPKRDQKNVMWEEQKKVLGTINHQRAAQQLVGAAQWGRGVKKGDKTRTFP